MRKNYEVIVVGGGHAGSEAAAAAANLGARTLMITMNLQAIGQMSCNPAMGGVAKGQIIREIDALGGLSGIVTDKSMVQFRMLNKSKGPAVWSPRAQSDRMRFAEEWRMQLEAIAALDFFQDMVTEVLVENGKVCGVKTGLGSIFKANSIILTSGTFLNGTIHVGEKQFGGGRAGDRASTGITACLHKYGFESGRMKTGTPPRVDGRSLDYSLMEEQKGDLIPGKFSYSSKTTPLSQQKSCYITYTSPEVHDILRAGFDRSPMFNGAIESVGPRYCPSIEDKIHRFTDKDRHQIFAEPEGWNTVEVYVNGFSTSLPDEIQVEALRKIKGFENAKIFRPGYAIEYDYFPPMQISHSMETKLLEGLFFAGQINGTTGYEEAACQGLMAGINAARKAKGESTVIIGRDEAYIGVLIDDLITKGTEEPYRMFTSRAEYRILLRQDNADERLTPKGREIGLIDDERWEEFNRKQKGKSCLHDFIQKHGADKGAINKFLQSRGEATVSQQVKLKGIVARPGVSLSDLLEYAPFGQYVEEKGLSQEILETTEIAIKYQGYIAKERENADKLNRLDNLSLPGHLTYHEMKSLSSEAREKLSKQRPETLGEARRISGVKPSDLSALLVYMNR